MCRKYWFEGYRPKPQGGTNFSGGTNNVLQNSVFSPNAGKSGKNADQNISEYGLFLRCENVLVFLFFISVT